LLLLFRLYFLKCGARYRLFCWAKWTERPTEKQEEGAGGSRRERERERDRERISSLLANGESAPATETDGQETVL
jgi:hypothetical protein